MTAPLAPDVLRNSFFSRILSRQSGGPEVDLPAIADSWLIPTNASWVWIWLRNSTGPTVQWELVASSSTGQPAPIPPSLTFEAGACFGDWCLRSGGLICGAQPRQEYQHSGQSYRAQFRDWFEQQGCNQVDVIPLISTVATPGTVTTAPALPVEVSGMIALHYSADRPRVPQAEHVLKRMGSLTTQTILRSFREKQLSLLVTLNALEAEFLPRFGKPRAAREDYIAELIKVMTNTLHSSAVSFFYLRPWSKTIACIGTTGLFDRRQGKAVSKELLPTVRYDLEGQTRTATCVRDGISFVRLAGRLAVPHQSHYMEMPAGAPLSGLPLIMIPLPAAKARSFASDSAKACGVIRVSGHASPLYPGEDKNYDALEIQLTEFIAAQVSPVLETFSHSIAREDAITVLKHDLLAPLNMLRDCLASAEKSPYERLGSAFPEYQLKYYDLKNMQYSQLFAQNLVMQLDVDPYEIKSLKLEPTSLEGDIIARLKNLMGHFASMQKGMVIRFTGFRSDDGTSTVPKLVVDKPLTERIFTNLISNAIKYGDEQTTVSIDAKLSNRGLHVYVSNQGVGISDSEAPYIFEPYFRGENAKGAATGAGLGLGIARNAIRAMGGNLILYSKRHPTVFDVFFPKSLFVSRS